jgi:peptidylprolyl isomerase
VIAFRTTARLARPLTVAGLVLGLFACREDKGQTKPDDLSHLKNPPPVIGDETPLVKTGAPPTQATTAHLPPQPKAPPGIPAPADVAAPPADAEKTSTGLASKILTAGKGKDKPLITDTVKVHYTGWTTDGKMFDSSVQRGEPISFQLNGVIPGWSEGVQLMVVGEKRRFWIPEELAYKGQPGRPQGMLVFEVELLDIMKPPKPPTDLAKPPADAIKEKDGLITRVLEKGKGKDRAQADSQATVHLTVWSVDGKLIQSTAMDGEPIKLQVKQLIPGVSEALQLMVEGEKRRAWVPPELAQRGQGQGPKETVVVDLELVKLGQ